MVHTAKSHTEKSLSITTRHLFESGKETDINKKYILTFSKLCGHDTYPDVIISLNDAIDLFIIIFWWRDCENKFYNRLFMWATGTGRINFIVLNRASPNYQSEFGVVLGVDNGKFWKLIHCRSFYEKVMDFCKFIWCGLFLCKEILLNANICLKVF